MSGEEIVKMFLKVHLSGLALSLEMSGPLKCMIVHLCNFFATLHQNDECGVFS